MKRNLPNASIVKFDSIFDEDILTPLQAQWVIEFLVDLSIKRSARRAGVSISTAQNWIRTPMIRQRINEQLSAKAKRTLLTADHVLADLFSIASVDIGEIFNEDGSMNMIKDIPRDVRKCIASVEVEEIWDRVPTENGENHKVKIGEVKKIRFCDKVKALEDCAKHLKLLTEKVEVQHGVSEELSELLKGTDKNRLREVLCQLTSQN